MVQNIRSFFYAHLHMNLYTVLEIKDEINGRKQGEMSDLIIFKLPKIDWTPGPDLTQRLKRFKQKGELLFDGPLKSRTNEQKCKYLLLWTGDYGLDLYSTWNLSEEQQKA